jgi:hypothetical protein
MPEADASAFAVTVSRKHHVGASFDWARSRLDSLLRTEGHRKSGDIPEGLREAFPPYPGYEQEGPRAG